MRVVCAEVARGHGMRRRRCASIVPSGRPDLGLAHVRTLRLLARVIALGFRCR